MVRNTKNTILGLLFVAVVAVLPVGLFVNQKQVTRNIVTAMQKQKENYESQLQEQSQKSKELLDKLEEQGKQIEALTSANKTLQAKNAELEGVRSIVLNNLGGQEPKKADLSLLCKLVEAEAGNEPFEGKVAVVNVVTNRIKSDKFPNTLLGVIYQKNQFEPVGNGVIYKMNPSEDTRKAVKAGLTGQKVVPDDVVNFWAVWLDRVNPVWNHLTPVMTIGGHHFAKGWES